MLVSGFEGYEVLVYSFNSWSPLYNSKSNDGSSGTTEGKYQFIISVDVVDMKHEVAANVVVEIPLPS